MNAVYHPEPAPLTAEFPTALMLEALLSIAVRSFTAFELGVGPAVLKGLADRGLLDADRGSPTIYTLTCAGQRMIATMTGAVCPVPYEGPIARIQRIVAQEANIPLLEMVSARRSRPVAWPRQMAMYFAREMTPMSLPEIGRRFGDRDHTTVIHACHAVEGRIASDPEYAAMVEAIRAMLEGGE